MRKTFPALLGATFILFGCNLVAPTGPTFNGFDQGSKLTGHFTVDGKAPSQALTASYRMAGAANTLGSVIADPSKLGYFAFTGDIKPGDYQIVFTDGGEIVVSGGNAISLYISDKVSSPPADLSQPQVTMDLKWEVKDFSPNIDKKFEGKFNFAKPASLMGPAEYFVTAGFGDKAKEAKDGTTNPKEICWTSKVTSDTSVDWSGKCSKTVGDTAGTTPDATASLFYRVNFVRSGTTQDFSGKKEFHGRTAWIPFTI